MYVFAGIFAYINYCHPKTRKEIIDALLTGLRRLEYRGYDSAGIGFVGDDGTPRPVVIREIGNIEALDTKVHQVLQGPLNEERVFKSHVGIAHTRWATHGPPSERNAHPQSSGESNEFIVVHNGILTNFKVLKELLMTKFNHKFVSDTDTEVIAHLCEHLYHNLEKLQSAPPSPDKLMLELMRQLEGAYAVIIMSIHWPNQLVACKVGSPLLLGLKGTPSTGRATPRPLPSQLPVTPAISAVHAGHIMSLGGKSSPSGVIMWRDDIEGLPEELFLSSDATAILDHTKDVVYLEDGDIVHVKKGRAILYHQSDDDLHPLSPFVGGDSVVFGDPIKSPQRKVIRLNMEMESIMKGGFPHFMLKEIYEQPDSLVNTMSGRIHQESGEVKLGGIDSYLPVIRQCKRFLIMACGTSYHSALVTRSIIEELTHTPVQCEMASDFLDRKPLIFRDDACLFVSQSGETADTKVVLEYCKAHGALCLGFTNTVGSAIARMTDAGVHLNAGVEIGVASTKAYTSQVVALILFALAVGSDYVSTMGRRKQIIQDLARVPKLVETTLKLNDQILTLAKELVDCQDLLMMGRGSQLATCMEGALKVKEVAYIHSEAIGAGELKHGPLALIEEEMPVLLIITKESEVLYKRLESAFQQIKARKCKPVLLCSEGDEAILKDPSISPSRVICVPTVCDAVQSIINVVPLQLLSYHLAVLRGRNVDQPRNLAKSVTVQ